MIPVLAGAIISMSAAGTFSFAGGSPNEFVAALAEATGKSVVLLADARQVMQPTPDGGRMVAEPAPVRKGEARWESKDDLLGAITREWDLGGAYAGDVLALWPKGWPDGVVHHFHAATYRSAFDRTRPSVEPDAHQRVTFHTVGKQALLVADARYLPGGNRLEVHWFHAWSYLAVSANEARSDDLLTAIAAACGARLERSDRSTSLQFDPAEFRRRYVAKVTQQRAGAQNDYERASADFVIEAMRTFTDSDLVEAFAREDGAVVREIPRDSALMTAFRARLASVESLASDPRAKVSLLPTLRALLGQMDMDAPIRVEYVNPNGVVAALVRSRGGDATIHF